MTHATPPGWYPDPGQIPGAPPSERWWDGTMWTDAVRAPGGSPAFPPQPPQSPRRRARTAVVIGVAVAVLAGIVGGVYALTAGDDDGDDDSAKPPASSGPSKPGEDDGEGPKKPDGSVSPGPSDGAPEAEEGFASDTASGISMPVPDGWEGKSGPAGAGVTTGRYPCPGDDTKVCVRGGAFSAPATAFKIRKTSPEAAAKADIEKNAEESYGGKIYGGKLVSHKQLASKSVTVAGQKGYLVRWKAVNRKGPDGYVQSLAFKSPADGTTMVIVRFGIDDTDDAPSVSVMDEITKGIKESRGGGGGDGQQV
ncbi:DUF2510 domain-containing protein [Streptomyces flavofungini]|uniref:DUF2510 domain-containing protein n=1 Tax=Streptomyces flavofungini TaxID=68200 RepID=UPI0025B02253|nr:DUF2510 domain-containing protein [Streptomyces flavofungini]WJV45161.1 DUF2510 domain-containing protein [Streptomyces flavofungini]